MKSPMVSIIMPAYNVEDSVVDSVEMVKRAMAGVTEDYEVIVVNDGSVDGTEKMLKRNEDSRVKIVNHRVNLGKGAAIKTGAEHATGEYTIILDADKDIDVKNVRSYIDALKKYDIVVGSKRHPNSIYQAPFLRKVLSVGFNALVKMLLGIRVGDTQTGFKAFRTRYLKRIMKVIVVKRYSWDAEALAVANLLRLRVAEAPVHIRQEKLFRFRDVLRMFLEVLGIVYRLRVLKWYQKNIGKEEPRYKLLLRI
jgi:glycosyltransferase involved in cell wall biosynthesis